MAISKQIDCVERELNRRQYEYRALVNNGEMSLSDAEHEILDMQRVVQVLYKVRDIFVFSEGIK